MHKTFDINKDDDNLAEAVAIEVADRDGITEFYNLRPLGKRMRKKGKGWETLYRWQFNYGDSEEADMRARMRERGLAGSKARNSGYRSGS